MVNLNLTMTYFRRHSKISNIYEQIIPRKVRMRFDLILPKVEEGDRLFKTKKKTKRSMNA